MADVTFDFNLDKARVDRIMINTLFKSVVKMQELARQKAPVDTGRLRNSIIFNPEYYSAEEYILIANVFYAIFIEFGTITQQAQPFMLPAKFEVERIWVRRFLQEELAKR